MNRVLIFSLTAVVVLALAPEIAWAQSWPRYLTEDTPDAHALQRGPGWYLAIYKLVLCLVTFLIWIRCADWVNRDLQTVGPRIDMPYQVWNPVVVFPFFAGMLFVITFPLFLLGYPLLVASFLGPLIVYVVQRNGKVAPEERVFTLAHLKRKMSGRPTPVVELPQDEGPPVEFSPAGPTEQDQQTNLIAARQNPAFLPVKGLIFDAFSKRAESVVLDYTRSAVTARLLVDGMWHPLPSCDRPTGDAMLVTLKTLAALNPADRRSRQEGSFGIMTPQRKAGCLLTTQGVKTGERVMMKFEISGAKSQLSSLAEIGMHADMQQQLREVLNEPGYVLVSCLPGDGMSTVWKSVLSAADRMVRDYHGVAEKGYPDTDVENVDYQLFDPATGGSMEHTLRQILLKEPEALVVPSPESGKIVDILSEQIIEEERYALSHLHAKSAAEAVIRFLALNPNRATFSKVFQAVVYQRLVRRLCDYCKQPYQPAPQLLQKLRLDPNQVQVMYREWQPPPPEELVDQKGRPVEPQVCKICGGIGYIGRIGVFELLRVDDSIRQIMMGRPTVEAVAAAARAAGNATLQENGIRLVAGGVTSLTELQRALKR